jgi:hypothetical protein
MIQEGSNKAFDTILGSDIQMIQEGSNKALDTMS